MAQAKCAHCGAALDGPVCKYCGMGTAAVEDLDKQRRALDEYHAQFSTLDKKEMVKLLKHGYLPDHPLVLVDAGLRCVSMLDDSSMAISVSDAATARLESIVMKLKLKSKDRETDKAIAMFADRVKEHKAQGNRDAIYGLSAIAILTAIIAAALWWILH